MSPTRGKEARRPTKGRRFLEEMLEGWSPGDYDEISHLLGRLSRELLRDDPEPVPAAPPSR